MDEDALTRLKEWVKPQQDQLKSFYNKIFTNQVSLTQGFERKYLSYYQSCFILRLVIFEPLYVSLQTLPDLQISLIFAIQLFFTTYTLVGVVKKIYYTWVFAAFRMATEASILFFLTMGLYCQFQYGKVSA